MRRSSSQPGASRRIGVSRRVPSAPRGVRGRAALAPLAAALVGLVLSSCGGAGRTTVASVTRTTAAAGASAGGSTTSTATGSPGGPGAATGGKGAKHPAGGDPSAVGTSSAGQARTVGGGEGAVGRGKGAGGGGAPAGGGEATGRHRRVSSSKGSPGGKHSAGSGLAPAAGAGAPATGGGSTEAAASQAIYEVRSLNMEPTYKPYVKLYYDQSDTTPTVNQIVLFRLPAAAIEGRCGDNPPPGHACQEAASELSSTLGVGRVVAVGGESVAFQEGNTIRDGQAQNESPFTKACGSGPVCSFSDPITVPQGSYYVLYDNRSQVDDSRVWGALPQAAIVGVVNGVAGSS
jgi:signal peptidase I